MRKGREMNGRVLLIPKGRANYLVILAVVLALSLIPSDTFAETGQVGSSENQQEYAVPKPGSLVATSSADNYTITWVWTAPEEPTSSKPADETVATEQNAELPEKEEKPTDIVEYGYELYSQEKLITSGTVKADVFTVSTAVKSDGVYTFNVRSITRESVVSLPAIGSITIASPIPQLPILTPIGPENIPAPIDTKPIANISSTRNNRVTSNSTPLPTSVDFGSNPARSNVLSATDAKKEITPVETVGVVKASNQGWVMFGLPWYAWLLIIGLGFVGWRRARLIMSKRNTP